MAETVFQRIERRIRETRDRLTEEGKLLTPEDLEHEYRTFAARFGPERLAALSGPQLLDLMAARGSTDSLPEWLESEGRTGEPFVFGELRPSGKYCLGLWFDPEGQCWSRFVRGREYARGETPYVRLTVSEAVDLSEWWRTQLLSAVELITALPEFAGDVAYLELQDRLETLAPDLVHAPWAHKYLAMCFPQRLDQFHDASWHRFMLIKCLETPPRMEDRRPPAYVSAGRFVRMARELKMPINHLCLSLEALFGRPHRYWLLETTRKEWEEFTSQGFIDQGWPLLGDLSVHSFEEELRWDDTMREKLRISYPGAHPRRVLEQLRWMVREVRDRDIVVAHQQAKVLGMAQVTAPYYYDPSTDLAHRRPIRAIEANLRTLPDPGAGRNTMHPLRATGALRLAIEEALLEKD